MTYPAGGTHYNLEYKNSDGQWCAVVGAVLKATMDELQPEIERLRAEGTELRVLKTTWAYSVEEVEV